MAFEYRIELADNIDRSVALKMLAELPYVVTPNQPTSPGEVWLSTNLSNHVEEVRIFSEPYGFFVEITSLPRMLSVALEAWINELRMLGKCTLLDNDTDEEVELLQ